MGRPAHVPTDETREQVRVMRSAGMGADVIASYLGIVANTLRKYYRHQVAQGKIGTIANIANVVVQKALKGDTVCALFYLKTQGKDFGWSERTEISGANGGAFLHKIERTIVHPKN